MHIGCNTRTHTHTHAIRWRNILGFVAEFGSHIALPCSENIGISVHPYIWSCASVDSVHSWSANKIESLNIIRQNNRRIVRTSLCIECVILFGMFKGLNVANGWLNVLRWLLLLLLLLLLLQLLLPLFFGRWINFPSNEFDGFIPT